MNHAKMTKAELLIEISRLEGMCSTYEDMVLKYREEVDHLHDELDRQHSEQRPWWGFPVIVCMAAAIWGLFAYAVFFQ